jgi:hypothetical protein
MLEGLESGDDFRLRLELVRGLLFSSSFSAISLNVAKRMGEKKVFFSFDLTSDVRVYVV